MSIVGTEGPDSLNGTPGDDVIDAGAGDDRITVTTGNDTVDGGEGEDELRATADSSSGQNYVLTGTALTGLNGALATTFTNIETFRFNDFSSGGSLTFDASAWGDNPNATAGVRLSIFSVAATVTGSSLDDRIFLDGIGHFVDGGAGEDRVSTRSGNSPLFISDDGDAVSITGANVSITAINVEVLGFSIGSTDSGYFIDGSQTSLALSMGNGVGNDTLIGGSGDDTFWSIDIADGVAPIRSGGIDVFTGGAGADLFSFFGSIVGMDNVTITDFSAEDRLDLSGNDDPGLLVSTFIGSAAFSGSAGEYRFATVGGQTQVQYDGDGDGVADGTLVLSNGEFTLVQFVGEFGEHNLGIGQITEGTLSGETLNGGAERDGIYGLAGNDVLSGGDGDDSLLGGAGWDTLIGGDGNDLIDGGNGNDTASYFAATGGVTVSLADGGVQDTGGSGFDVLRGIENLIGSDFSDSLTGDDAVNLIEGGLEADTLIGAGGSDLLFGDEGDDALTGGTGWDQLNGGAGDDVLVGENGGDLFKGGTGDDTIFGGAGTDRAFLGDGADTAFGGGDNDVLNGQAGNDVLFGDGGDDELVGSSGEDALDGGEGNDTLNGGGQNDVLVGGEGNDILIGSWSVDTLTGGAGADTFVFDDGHTGRWRGNADVITDFENQTDVIDLSGIDAIAGGDDDAFTFIGNSTFSNTAGELLFYVQNGATYLAGDTNGDGVADFQIKLEGEIPIFTFDLIL